MPRLPSSADITALRDDAVVRHVRQLGSAHSGLREWRVQRWTALALIPLGLWFVVSVLHLATSDRVTAAAWLASPVPALLVLLFVFAVLTHALVGLRSVLMDYVHTQGRLKACDLLLRAVTIFFGAASTLAVLKLFLGR
jgi:succinate dehydrogenase / fumarate reductase membrane anchor subunit